MKKTNIFYLFVSFCTLVILTLVTINAPETENVSAAGTLNILNTTPAQSAHDIAKNANINIVFDQAMDLSTANTTNLPVFSEKRGRLAGSYSLTTTNIANDTIVFDPSNDFPINDQVQAVVTTAVKSATVDDLPQGAVATVFRVESNGGLKAFSYDASYQTGGSNAPDQVVSADFDGDGDIDAATSNGNGSIFLNDGNGVMTLSQTFTGVGEELIAGDLDGDGDVDLLFPVAGLQPYLNDGSGNFSAGTLLSVGTTKGGVVADFDGDGDLDAATASISDDTVRVFSNDGSAVFSLAQSYNVGTRTWGGTIGDFNNDGDMDFAFASDASSSVFVFTNDGTGSFTNAEVTGLSVINNQNIDAGDVDGDGDLDIVTGGSSGVQILSNTAGTFTASTFTSAADGKRDVLFGDLDGDGDLDVAGSSLSDTRMTTFNNSGGSLSVYQTLNQATAIRSGDGITLADFDGDEDLDAAEISRDNMDLAILINRFGVATTSPEAGNNGVLSNSNIDVQFNDSLNAGTVTASNVIVRGSDSGLRSGTLSVITTDLSNDTIRFDPDNDFFPGERIEVTLKTGIQSSSAEGLARAFDFSFIAEPTAGNGTYALATGYGLASANFLCAADFDGDGDIDAAANGSTELKVMTNDGTGIFEITNYSVVSGVDVVCEDVNGDARSDLIFATSSLGVMLNNGDGTFAGINYYSSVVGVGYGYLTYGDFDGDGDLDFVQGANSGTVNGFVVFLNNGSGAFASGVAYDNGLSGLNTRGVEAKDFNNDGIIDIASIENTNNPPQVAINLGNGDGTFGAQFAQYTLPSGSDAREILADDLDGDNNVDLIAIHGGTDMTILSGYGDGRFSVDSNFSIFAGGTCTKGLANDYDNDGDLDVVVACQDEFVSIGQNNGSANFTLLTNVQAAVESYNNGDVDAADFNNDGALDIISSASSQGIVSVSLADLEVPTVEVVQPNGGETLTSGSSYDVIWKSNDNSGSGSALLEYASDGVSFSTVASSLTNDGKTYSYDSEVAGTGTANGEFSSAERVEVDYFGNVYISDSANQRVQKFDRSGTFLGWIGNCTAGTNCDVGNEVTTGWCTDCTSKTTAENGDGQLSGPHGIATIQDGSLLVADTGNNRINRYDASGAFVGCLGGGTAGFQMPCLSFTAGSSDGQFSSPYDVDYSRRVGNFWVADTGNNRIQRFTNTGSFIIKAGTFGTGNGEYDGPQGITIVPDSNTAYVADTGNNRIQKINGNNGTFTQVIGSSGTGNGQLFTPTALSSDTANNVYVADSGNNRIQKFSSGGSYQAKIGSFGTGDGQFDDPRGLVRSQFDELFIVDTGNDRYQKLSPGRTYTWTVPAGLTTLAKMRVTYTDPAGQSTQDQSDAAFEITGPNTAPATTTPTSVSQATDGSGYITFQTTVSDVDSDTTRLQVEYSDDGGATYYDAEIISATPDSGSVDVNNANTYQIGTSNAIDTNGGSVLLTIVWDSKSANNGNGPVTGQQSDIRLRLTPNDNLTDGTTQANGNFTVDNQIPIGLTALTEANSSATEVELSWGAVTEANFNHYEIWYGENQADVVNRTGSAEEWDGSDDANMDLIATTSTTITGLDASTSYFFKIFAVDNFGNEETVLELSLSTGGTGGRRRTQFVLGIDGSVSGIPSEIIEDTTIGVEESEPLAGSGGGGGGDLKGSAGTQGSGINNSIQTTNAIGKIEALKNLFVWMNPEDYQLMRPAIASRIIILEEFNLREIFKTLSLGLGYSDGVQYVKPDRKKIENIAELLKVMALNFNECFSNELLDRMKSHDRLENGWWWAGYWHVLGGIIPEPYQVWDSVLSYNKIDLIETLLLEYCPPAFE